MKQSTIQFARIYIEANNNVMRAYDLLDTNTSADPEFTHSLKENARLAEEQVGELNKLAGLLNIEIDIDSFRDAVEM